MTENDNVIKEVEEVDAAAELWRPEEEMWKCGITGAPEIYSRRDTQGNRRKLG